MPNNKQETYFRKAIGCARLAYNWGLDEWERRHKSGEKLLNAIVIRNAFNAIRREQFPFTYEVTKYATAYAFNDLYSAFKNFFAHRADRPKYHKKKDGYGSFYVVTGDKLVLANEHKGLECLKGTPHNTNGKYQYLKVPSLGYVKMAERVRFNGKIKGVRIKQEHDKYYARFTVEITEEEYLRTHPNANAKRVDRAVGIDVGLKEAMVLSDAIRISQSHPYRVYEKKLSRMTKHLSKRQHTITKDVGTQGATLSNNYRKYSRRLGKIHRHIANIRRDFQNKLTTIITTTYGHIVIEGLDVEGWMKRRNVAKNAWDSGIGEIMREIKYKAALNKTKLTIADQFFPSSKICSCCGSVKDYLPLDTRTYRCEHCGAVIDRDYNASLNLLGLVNKQVGTDRSKLTPADLGDMFSRLKLNGITFNKVETGRKQKPQPL